jgi:hypothetical protein
VGFFLHAWLPARNVMSRAMLSGVPDLFVDFGAAFEA